MSSHYNIADMYEIVADKVPARDALVCGDQRATYGQLEQRANQLAHYLQQQGVLWIADLHTADEGGRYFQGKVAAGLLGKADICSLQPEGGQ